VCFFTKHTFQTQTQIDVGSWSKTTRIVKIIKADF